MQSFLRNSIIAVFGASCSSECKKSTKPVEKGLRAQDGCCFRTNFYQGLSLPSAVCALVWWRGASLSASVSPSSVSQAAAPAEVRITIEAACTGEAADGILSRGTDFQAAGCLGSGSCQEGVGLHGVIDVHLFSKDLFHAADT